MSNDLAGFSDADAAFPSSFLELVKEVNTLTIKKIRDRVQQLPEPASSGLFAVFDNFPSLLMVKSFAQRFSLALAYDLGITSIDDLVRIDAASMYGSYYALLIDRIVDDNAKVEWARLPATYLAHVLFIYYLESLSNIHPLTWNSDAIRTLVDSELQVTCATYAEERLHVERATPYKTVQLIADKCAGCKSLGERILALAGRTDLRDELFAVIDDTSYAYCTFDDLVDWESDLECGRYMYPIQRALDVAGVDPFTSSPEQTKAAVLRHLVCGPAYHDIMRDVIRVLNDLARRSSRFSNLLTVCYTHSQRAATQSWDNHIAFLRRVAAS